MEIIVFFYTKTKELSRVITKSNHKYDGVVIEAVNNFKYLKASGRSKLFVQRMIRTISEITDNNVRMRILQAKQIAVREPMMISIVCVAILINILFFKSKFADIMVILVLFYRAIAYIMAFQYAWNNFLTDHGALENIQDFQKYLDKHQEHFKGNEAIESIEYIKLDKVSFNYGNFKAIDDISITINKNQSIALVGESGSGKTSLVNIICTLLPFTKGTFYVNGKDIRDINNNQYKNKIGYITQEATIFNGTIYENITFWAEHNEENLKKFWKAIDMCSLRSLSQIFQTKKMNF